MPDADSWVADALAAARGADVRRAEAALDHLAFGDPALVDAALHARLAAAVGRLWARGWQPLDVDRIAVRRLTSDAARLARAAVVAQRGLPGPVPQWFDDQLADLAAGPDVDVAGSGGRGARAAADRITLLRDAIEALSLIEGLPRIAQLRPPPGAPGALDRMRAGPSGSRMLDRVRSLLAKAESTTFPAEAQALTGKAQELMARHSIDTALLDRADRPDQPGGIRLSTDPPYAAAKALLVNQVARANRCESVWSEELGFATVLGFPADLVAVELLYTSLLVQATAAMVRGRDERRPSAGRRRTKEYDESFLNAFALRIGERLRSATESADEEAARGQDGDRLLPVLAARSDAVRERMDSLFPHLAPQRLRVRDEQGWSGGTTAADRASFDVGGPAARAVGRRRG